ncbi:MAG: IS1595 family transposase [Verrucomicrobiaceae bacterium]|nr:IS1595 family transposase [Verrucomicrobiaceae bacterium]
MNDDQNTFPETLTEAIRYFSDPDKAFAFMKSLRWPDGNVTCAKCGCDRVSFLSTRKVWKCLDCKKQFSAKVGTIFEDSALGYDKWFPAFWMIVNAKNGISSCELARAIGVTQKSAWHMLHRIRLALQDGSITKMEGNVEADETYIGAKARSMNAKQKAKREAVYGHATGGVAMTAVQGLLERGTRDKASRVKLKVLKTTKKPEVQANVKEYVLKGSEVHTDALKSYQGLENDFVHQVVDHAVTYVKGNVHTNGLENFWCLLKRMIKGTYVCPAPFHLFRYLDEQAFRFNERKDDDQGRFLKGIMGIVGKGLRYAKLIGEGEPNDYLPA